MDTGEVEINIGHTEQKWVKQIREGNEHAFEKLFMKYYSSLVNFAFSYLKCNHIAEEVVQDIFADCWDRREELDHTRNIKTYLFQSVKFKSLDILKHRDVKNRYHKELKSMREEKIEPEFKIDSTNQAFVKAVQKAIQALPDRAQRVYVLHRKEGLTYKEIADVMDISPKTVESQMSRALKILRNRLDKFVSAFMMAGLLISIVA